MVGNAVVHRYEEILPDVLYLNAEIIAMLSLVVGRVTD
jgi:hypothetical protein